MEPIDKWLAPAMRKFSLLIYLSNGTVDVTYAEGKIYQSAFYAQENR